MAIQLSDEWSAFEAAIGMRPKFGGKDIDETKRAAEMARAGQQPLPASTTLRIYDEMLDGFEVRVYEPLDVGLHGSAKMPLFSFAHGGGFCVGDLDSEEELVRFMAENIPAVFVSVNYRLAPKYQWPQSRNDCITAAKWALKHFQTSDHVDTSKLILCGDSAGAQLSLSTALGLVDQGHLVHGIAVLAPLTIGQSAVPKHMSDRYRSMTENADAPIVDAVLLKQFMDANGHDDKDPDFSILLNENLGRLPRTYIVTCGADCLRDDGFLLADELRSRKVEVKHDNYPGYPHCFWAMPQLKENVKFRANLIRGMQFLLS